MKEPAIYTPDPGESERLARLGRRIQEIADEHGGQTKLADLIGVGRSTLSGWCSGAFEPKARHLRRAGAPGRNDSG